MWGWTGLRADPEGEIENKSNLRGLVSQPSRGSFIREFWVDCKHDLRENAIISGSSTPNAVDPADTELAGIVKALPCIAMQVGPEGHWRGVYRRGRDPKI